MDPITLLAVAVIVILLGKALVDWLYARAHEND